MSCAIVMNNRSLSCDEGFMRRSATDWHDPFRDGDTSDASVRRSVPEKLQHDLAPKNIACLAGKYARTMHDWDVPFNGNYDLPCYPTSAKVL